MVLIVMTMLIVGRYRAPPTHNPAPKEFLMDGRTLWVHHDDVAGPLDEGCIVRAAHPLNDWCLRADDGSEPVETGTLLEIIEARPWGAAMAQELPDVHDEPMTVLDELIEAARELETLGLFEVVEAAG